MWNNKLRTSGILSRVQWCETPASLRVLWLYFLKVAAIMVARRYFCSGGRWWRCFPCVHMCECVSFIFCPHTGTKCTSGLFSCVQGSVSCSPKPRKLQSSQAENRSGNWTTGFTCLRPRAHKVTPTVNVTTLCYHMKQWCMSVGIYMCALYCKTSNTYTLF